MALQTPQKIRCAGLLSFFLPVEAATAASGLTRAATAPKISPLRGAIIRARRLHEHPRQVPSRSRGALAGRHIPRCRRFRADFGYLLPAREFGEL